MSAGVFTLQSADVKTVMPELDKILGAARRRARSAGILRIVPIERMNALLVITPQPGVPRARRRSGSSGSTTAAAATGARFYVYNLQNQRAESSAPLLQQAFTGRAPPAGDARRRPTLAPGTPAGTIVVAAAVPAAADAAGRRRRPSSCSSAAGAPRQQPAHAGRAPGDGLGIVRNIQVVADKDNNTLLVVATPAEYTVHRGGAEEARRRRAAGDDRGGHRRGLAARRVPLRRRVVLQERREPGRRQLPPRHRCRATSSARACHRDRRGRRRHRSARAGLHLPLQQLDSPAASRRRCPLLDTYGNTKVIANPHVAALDNQKATIKVGDRIPIYQQTLGRRHAPTRSRRRRSTSTPACCCR